MSHPSALPYVLGHTHHELERLKAQAALIDPITRRFFVDAGLVPGMRVLDVGSGVGDVAFVAGGLVGPSGRVVGVDRSGPALEVARGRAQALGLENVIRFVEGDAGDVLRDESFDAVVGRYVLQFQRSPAALLRELAARVRPGGLVVFHEIDWTGVHALPQTPTFARCWQWGIDTLQATGTQWNMGTQLHTTFMDAGLGAPTMRLEALVGGIETMAPWVPRFVAIMTSLAPAMKQHGIATEQDLQLETLADRLLAEFTSARSLVVAHFQVGAWATVGRSVEGVRSLRSVGPRRGRGPRA
jgi:ubiquinone/menaquinone biosynthesis C-methylase UbiE